MPEQEITLPHPATWELREAPAPVNPGIFIIPSVGRKVWYRPSAWDRAGAAGMITNEGAPLDATIVAVHHDRSVNLVVFDSEGTQFKRGSVPLLQGADQPTSKVGYAEWMPYQKQSAGVCAPK